MNRLLLASALLVATQCAQPAFAAEPPVRAAVTSAAASSLLICVGRCAYVDAYVVPTVNGYLMAFDATTAPADGTVTPQECVPAAANIATSLGATPSGLFTSGIILVFSTTGCFTKTASATAFLHGRAL